LKDDPYDVASDIGKKYNWSVKKIEQAERVIRKSYINGIGAVKKLEYNKEALNLLRMLKTVVKSAKDLNGVTVYPTSFGYWAVSRKGRGLFMVQQGSLSESTIKKYGLR
jgi:hypothetical protein